MKALRGKKISFCIACGVLNLTRIQLKLMQFPKSEKKFQINKIKPTHLVQGCTLEKSIGSINSLSQK